MSTDWNSKKFTCTNCHKQIPPRNKHILKIAQNLSVIAIIGIFVSNFIGVPGVLETVMTMLLMLGIVLLFAAGITAKPEETCPHCGNPVSEEDLDSMTGAERKRGIVSFLVAIFLLAIGVYIFFVL